MTSTVTYDAIVVGSGMTGGFAAKELTEQGLKTLVLERGRHITHGADYITEHKPLHEFPFRGMDDRREAERAFPRQSQHPVFDEAKRHFLINDRHHPYTHDPHKPFLWIRGDVLGGRSLLWSRQCLRLTDLDFEANAREGIAIDWPIRYRDLAPWYDHVEAFMGISAEAGAHPTVPSVVMPPIAMNAAERHLKDAIHESFLDRTVTDSPQAVLTRDHNGRLACHYCGPCSRGCSTGSYFSSLSATLPAARATGNLTLRADSIVHSIRYDERADRASGVRVIDAKTGKTRDYFGRLIFVCASAMESVRLLLNSKSPRFPTGLANSSGVLGHYIMAHIMGGGAVGLIRHVETGGRYYNGSKPGMLYIPRFRNLTDQRTDYVRGFHMQAGAGLEGWRRGISMPGIGADLKHALRDPGAWDTFIGGTGECLPRHENRMTLNADQQDAWGIPTPHFEVAWTANELNMRNDMAVAAAEMLEAAGADAVETYNEPRPPGRDNHEMGGARMGHDPRTSVLNAYNQAHDVPNLFVTDGACMTSGANQNPSLTFMALTARACHYAVEQLKRGEI